MRTFIGSAPLVLALSPWILPSIAAAAKLTHEAVHDACRELGQNRSRDRGNARTDGRARNRPTQHVCIEAKLASRREPQ